MTTKKGKAWSQAEEAKLMKMYNDGSSHADIAKALKRTKTSVSQRIYKMNKSPDTRVAIGSVKDNDDVAQMLEDFVDSIERGKEKADDVIDDIEYMITDAYRDSELRSRAIVTATFITAAAVTGFLLGYNW